MKSKTVDLSAVLTEFVVSEASTYVVMLYKGLVINWPR